MQSDRGGRVGKKEGNRREKAKEDRRRRREIFYQLVHSDNGWSGP